MFQIEPPRFNAVSPGQKKWRDLRGEARAIKTPGVMGQEKDPPPPRPWGVASWIFVARLWVFGNPGTGFDTQRPMSKAAFFFEKQPGQSTKKFEWAALYYLSRAMIAAQRF